MDYMRVRGLRLKIWSEAAHGYIARKYILPGRSELLFYAVYMCVGEDNVVYTSGIGGVGCG